MNQELTTDTHHGVQLGLLVLVSMLLISSCMAFAQTNPATSSSNWTPAWGPLAQSQPTGLQGQAGTVVKPAATFIVRIKNDPVITDICRTYRRDTPAAIAKFTRWQASHPATRGLTLEQASYSGDIVLGLPANDPMRRTPQAVLASLRSMANVAYADINDAAYPSREGP